MGKILIIGSLNMDIVLSVEKMPCLGETIIGKGLEYNLGGKGANQACAAGLLGGNVHMLGSVGKDNFGDELTANLTKAGVDMSLIRRSDTLPTGAAAIYVDQNGSNSIVVIPGANGECGIDYLKENDTAFCGCDYILLQMEIPPEAVYYAVTRGYELGKTVILNPAPAPDSIPEEIISKINYITPNETELARLSGNACESEEQLFENSRKLAEKVIDGVLVTIGKNGALYSNGTSSAVYPTIDMPVVDTTAAGDCFNAAFVVALSEGNTIERAIKFANTAAALSVSKRGAQISLPNREETERHINRK